MPFLSRWDRDGVVRVVPVVSGTVKRRSGRTGRICRRYLEWRPLKRSRLGRRRKLMLVLAVVIDPISRSRSGAAPIMFLPHVTRQ